MKLQSREIFLISSFTILGGMISYYVFQKPIGFWFMMLGLAVWTIAAIRQIKGR